MHGKVAYNTLREESKLSSPSCCLDTSRPNQGSFRAWWNQPSPAGYQHL